MRHTILTLLLLAPALGGCVSGVDVSPAATSDVPGAVGDAAATLPWGLEACEAIIAIVPVPAERVAPHLPEGFTATIPESLGLPPDPRGDAVMGLEALSCREAAGLNGTVGPNAVYGSFWTFVEPPAELKREGADLHFVKWDTLVHDADLRAALQAAGVPAVDGDVAFTLREARGNGGAWSAGLTMEDAVFGLHGASPQNRVEFTGAFVEYTATDNGLVEWSTSFDAEQAYAGAGYVKLQPGSLPHEVVGQERAPAYFMSASGVRFFDATVTLPAAPTAQ